MEWQNAKLVHVAKIDNLRYNCEFISTNDEYIWKDTPDQKSINAAFRNKEELAETIPYNQVDHVSWTALQVLPGYQVRIKGQDEYQFGDTPHEAASYLSFEQSYSIDRDHITSEQRLEDQIQDILLKLHGSVHYKTIPNFLNYNELDSDSIKPSEVLSKLDDMESKKLVYTTTDGSDWWTTQSK